MTDDTDADVNSAFSLAGRRALVTGAARGIGRGIAVALARAGADVVVSDIQLAPYEGQAYYRLRQRISDAEERGQSTAEAVRALGRQADELQLDVADADAVMAAADECGRIDILVNNAGIVNNIADIADMAPAAWAHEIDVNLSGAFHCVRAFVPAMAQRGWGRVINIASVAALRPGRGQPAYTASKAGVAAFAQSVAQEFGRRGVTANSILPGLIATPLVKSMPAHIRERALAAVPAGRLGQPRDIGHLAAFLASDAAAYVSGVAIACDGGMTFAGGGGLQ